jgi:hypothetical protein
MAAKVWSGVAIAVQSALATALTVTAITPGTVIPAPVLYLRRKAHAAIATSRAAGVITPPGATAGTVSASRAGGATSTSTTSATAPVDAGGARRPH